MRRESPSRAQKLTEGEEYSRNMIIRESVIRDVRKLIEVNDIELPCERRGGEVMDNKAREDADVHDDRKTEG